MALDGLMLSGITKELQILQQAKIGKIQNLCDEEICFSTHTKAGAQKLIINVHSNTNRMYMTNQSFDALPSPSNFVMVLRKYISQGIITRIEQEGFDRIVKISILGHNELQDTVAYDLYVELMGKYSNLILVCSSDQTIIDCLKRIPVYENSKRLLHPGARYELPEKPLRLDPRFIEDEQIDLETSLVKQAEGFSPLLSREFLFRMNNGQKFREITEELFSSDTLYIYEKDFHILPLLHLGSPVSSWPLMKGLHHLYAQNENKIRIQQQAGDVFKTVSRELKRLEKKLPKLEASLESSRDYDQYRICGDLLFSYMGQIEKQPVVQLEDFETGQPISIQIDMRYDLKTNGNLYYKKYHKAKRSLEILQQQIDQCKEEIEYFRQLDEQLKHCSVEDALEIREELIKNRVMPEKKLKAVRKQKNKKPHVLHLQMEGADIYAGKNNLQNNYITHKLSRKEDYWFHVKDYHGSHVLLKTSSPSEAQIRLCAMLAAWFSKGSQSSSVPVDYTTISMLKKVPGSKIGLVTMKRYNTIYIDPDPTYIEEILACNSKKS